MGIISSGQLESRSRTHSQRRDRVKSGPVLVTADTRHAYATAGSAGEGPARLHWWRTNTMWAGPKKQGGLDKNSDKVGWASLMLLIALEATFCPALVLGGLPRDKTANWKHETCLI